MSIEEIQLTIFVLSIVFCGGLVRSIFGFGDAVISMPLLALIMSLKIATPLVALIGLTNAILILSDSWRTADFRAAAKLIVGSMIGIPIGLFVLKLAPEILVKSILGAVLISFGIFNLRRPVLPYLKNEKFAYVFGLTSGMLGGAYNTNGPPAVIYGMLRRWKPDEFRATMQGLLLPANLVIVSGHGLMGLWQPRIFKWFLMAMPLVLLASYIGKIVNNKFAAENFLRILYFILIILGILLFIK